MNTIAIPSARRLAATVVATALLLTPSAAGASGRAPAHVPVTAAGSSTTAIHTITPDVDDPVAVTKGFYRFTLMAPGATAVSVTGSWGLSYTSATYAMNRSGDTWTAVLGPLTPGIYSYTFTVDGVATRDPANANTVHVNPALTTFLVPGRSADFLTPQRGPKGVLSILTYHSTVTGTERQATVWTPPGYSTRSRSSYPTLYLIHGGGGDYLDWIQQGDANAILDNLINRRAMTPMVVVMADGNVPGALGTPQNDSFQTEILDNIVPAIEAAYRVSRSPADRALAGLSLGGLQAFNVLLNAPGSFRYVGDFSSGYFPPVIDALKAGTLLTNPAINSQTKLLRIYIGNPMDIAYANNIATRALFDRFGVHYQFAGVYKPGGHTWNTWQHNLADFTPRLFRR